MAVLTLHHWTDWRARHRGDAARRAARRRALAGTRASRGRLWISADYFPELIDEDVAHFPSLADQAGALRAQRVTAVPIPHDCRDGFYGAHWRRPEAYLDPVVRAGHLDAGQARRRASSTPGLARLADDLRTGAWAERHADLLELDELDLGYRLLVSGEGAAAPAA